MNKLLLDLPSQLETQRLIVRPYQPGDGPAYFDVCQRNKEHLLPFEHGNPALSVDTVEDAEVLMRQFAIHWAAREVFFLGAWETANNSFAAQIYIGVANWNLPEFELGYFVDCAHKGKGFVTEAAEASLALIFDFMGARRVRLECNELNSRSWRLAERCGFIREGYLRQRHPDMPREDGIPSGDFVYGLLKEEFEQRRQE